MDAIDFLSNRQISADSIFSSSQEMTDCEEDYPSILKALDNLLEKQVKAWWDVFTFEHYNKEGLIFRSLRWEVTPQDGLTDVKYMDEWLNFFNKVGKELQVLVLKRKQIKLSLINEKIKIIQKQLEPIKESEMIKEFNNSMKKKLEKVDRDTQKRKVKKYNRDSEDFKNSKIYAWQSNTGSEGDPVNDTTEQQQSKTSVAALKKDSGKPKGPLKKADHTGGNHPRNNLPQGAKGGHPESYYESPGPPRHNRENGQYSGYYQSPRPQQHYGVPDQSHYYPQQDYHQWYQYPPSDQYHHQPQSASFLGQRGRGGRGGTPKRNLQPMNRGGEKTGPPYLMNRAGEYLQREEGGAGLEDASNPKKRARRT